jgi:hypothetical protein
MIAHWAPDWLPRRQRRAVVLEQIAQNLTDLLAKHGAARCDA